MLPSVLYVRLSAVSGVGRLNIMAPCRRRKREPTVFFCASQSQTLLALFCGCPTFQLDVGECECFGESCVLYAADVACGSKVVSANPTPYYYSRVFYGSSLLASDIIAGGVGVSVLVSCHAPSTIPLASNCGKLASYINVANTVIDEVHKPGR